MAISNKLKQYFPMIKTREEVLREIKANSQCNATFSGWREEHQEEFLDICTGVRGVKIIYDPFFKEILNPEYDSKPLDSLLSELLGRKVKILHVLPNDGTRIANEDSLLITDLVVELEDRTIANVEIQKIGYRFPGQRAACYSSDLVLRQYKRLRDSTKKFSYSDIKDVYTIVIFEKSPEEFLSAPDTYIHYAQARCDSGVELNLVQKYIFINLDTFRKKRHNTSIDGMIDAWLTFMSADEPEVIIRLIEEYPEFKPLYEIVYNMCRNVEDVMSIFSKELQILDRNTVRLMIDDMQKEIEEKDAIIERLTEELTQTKEKLAQTKEKLAQTRQEFEDFKGKFANLEKLVMEKLENK